MLPATCHHEKDRPVVSELPEGDGAGQTPQAGRSTLGNPASSPAKQTARPPLAAPPRPPCEAFVMLQQCRPLVDIRSPLPKACSAGGVLVTSEIPAGEGSVPWGAPSLPRGPHWGTWYAVGCVSFHTFSPAFH